MKGLVAFNLNGTLLNTTVDLTHNTDYALNRLGYPAYEAGKYNLIVGNSTGKFFGCASPEGEESKENVLCVCKEFIPYYSIHNIDDSHPHPGTSELFSYLQDAGIQVVVVSNKYQAATQKLINRYFPEIHFTVAFRRREGMEVKPGPTVVFNILEVAGVTKEGVLRVGDSDVDMQTATNARMTVRGVVWGLRSRAELGEFSSQYIVDIAEEIKRFIL